MNSLCARSWLPWAERVSFMNNNRVIRRQSHLSPMGVYPRSACFVSSRSVATYPTPHVRLTRGRRAKKNFNFLTSQRLVPVETKPRREEIRRRDDRAWARRNMYHQQHMEDVSTRIHYFNAKLRDLIFFPKTRSSTKKPFLGNRSLCATLFARIHYGVTCQLVGGENRDKLKGILTKALESHPELPRLTEADWRRCTDPTTGNISVGLRYSLSMCRLFVEIGRLIHHGKKNGTPPNLKARHAFIMTQFGDLTKVRSLEQWNEEHDKLKVEDLFTIRQRGITSMSIQTVRRKKELEEYGIPQIYAALGSMSPAEQHALILHAVNHADKLLKFMEQRLFFAAHIELALLSLPEIRSIQAPVRVFFSEFRALHIVRARGAVFPAIHSHAARLAWKAIPVEGQAAYTCFGRRMDRSTMSGQQLFHRYCKRDYGLEQSEISRRYAQLTDMQTAALNFPFYYPITPKRSTSLAFRRFYLKMCAKFGFARSSGPGTGSRPFEAAMRVKWYGMTEDARREYEDKDSLHNAVPMILEGRTLRSTKPVSQDTASSPRQTEKKKIAQDQLLAPSPTLNSSQPNGSSMHERTMWEMPRNLTQHDMSTPRMTGSRESPQVLIV